MERIDPFADVVSDRRWVMFGHEFETQTTSGGCVSLARLHEEFDEAFGAKGLEVQDGYGRLARHSPPLFVDVQPSSSRIASLPASSRS